MSKKDNVQQKKNLFISNCHSRPGFGCKKISFPINSAVSNHYKNSPRPKPSLGNATWLSFSLFRQF